MSIFIPLDGTPNEKQQEFMDATQRFVAIGGGRGLGKTWTIRRLAVKYAMEHDNSRVLVVRRDRWGLDFAILYPMRLELNGIAEECKTEHRFRFPNGSVIVLGFCNNEEDIHKFAGKYFDLVCIDEAQELTDYQLTFLQNCGIPRPLMRYTISINPAAPSFAMLKKWFVEKKYKGAEKPNDYALIHATVLNNPYLSDDYFKQLQALPEELRKQMLDGEW